VNAITGVNNMANTQLFQTLKDKFLSATNVVNEAGGAAYALQPKQALAQLAVTGCLNNTYYAGAAEQLDKVLELAAQVDAAFVAKTAIYARERGHMKDMPALLLATLAVRDVALFAQAFPRVVDNGKMLRNVVQILRSGRVGRKSLGSRPKKLVQNWLCQATEKQLLNASVGNSPSLADVVKMVHPKPADAWRAAWFAWLIGRDYDATALPAVTQAYEAYKKDRSGASPDVPFQMLTALELTANQWTQIAKNGSWQMVRQNLNTFARHGVFGTTKATKAVAAKLRDAQSIANARVLPYQLLAAYKATDALVPVEVREALQDAMEIALQNVPEMAGQIVVCPDVSGSMSSAVTGQRGSATSAVRCIDVAALVAAALLRKNPSTEVLPFEQQVVKLVLNPRDSVMTNAEKLAAIGGGGTNCSAPLAELNERKAKADLVVLVSDNESWVDAKRHGATQTMREWELFKQRNPRAKLVCIDIQPYAHTQASERADILNIGGFTDEVFKVLTMFAAGELGAEHWVGVIDDVAKIYRRLTNADVITFKTVKVTSTVSRKAGILAGC
jgi:60 kDa SS-A/Ro ribonucleoprotein